MIDPTHLVKYVIKPVLEDLGLWSEAAVKLLLGTCCQESECGMWLHQLGVGPALGIYGMEGATHDYLHDWLAARHPDLQKRVWSWAVTGDATEMIGNLYYATAMCRTRYLRVPEPIPETLPGQAAYWKKWYNTPLGKGTEEEYIANWRRFVPATLTLV